MKGSIHISGNVDTQKGFNSFSILLFGRETLVMMLESGTQTHSKHQC